MNKYVSFFDDFFSTHQVFDHLTFGKKVSLFSLYPDLVGYREECLSSDTPFDLVTLSKCRRELGSFDEKTTYPSFVISKAADSLHEYASSHRDDILWDRYCIVFGALREIAADIFNVQ